MFEAIFEFLFELFAETVLVWLIEGLLQIGLRPLVEPFRAKPHPWLAAAGYGLFGMAAGALTLLWFPNHLLRHPWMGVANLMVTPVLVGLGMAALGRRRTRHGRVVTGLDKFLYAFLFAMGLAVVRYLYGG